MLHLSLTDGDTTINSNFQLFKIKINKSEFICLLIIKKPETVSNRCIFYLIKFFFIILFQIPDIIACKYLLISLHIFTDELGISSTKNRGYCLQIDKFAAIASNIGGRHSAHFESKYEN